jgi:hypothetical protein
MIPGGYVGGLAEPACQGLSWGQRLVIDHSLAVAAIAVASLDQVITGTC